MHPEGIIKMTECKRAVAYVRVSSASQVEGYSLDAQERTRPESV
ncbi:hypothetical protein C1G87_1400 [Dehalococcoides mccartyi]|uniref:Recombinase-domain containing protein n=1 Tax=Dehalococcoides mccartyi TaxID=61435 RepID=A0A142VDA4_9CHLR|nr:recombinase-domain containing protein [Dehalococcoides mccartyi]RAL68926.1 hypothetical protein C1G87_1400 [Dehalococcoides mccartyi]